MGAVAAPLAVGLLGMGLSAVMSNKMMKNSAADAGQLQALSQQNAQNAIDTMPQLPEAPTGNEADADTNEAEAERKRQLAALSANDKAFNPTGGLGATAPVNTKKKTLGGSL